MKFLLPLLAVGALAAPIAEPDFDLDERAAATGTASILGSLNYITGLANDLNTAIGAYTGGSDTAVVNAFTKLSTNLNTAATNIENTVGSQQPPVGSTITGLQIKDSQVPRLVTPFNNMAAAIQTASNSAVAKFTTVSLGGDASDFATGFTQTTSGWTNYAAALNTKIPALDLAPFATGQTTITTALGLGTSTFTTTSGGGTLPF